MKVTQNINIVFSNDLFDDLGGENPTMIQQRIQNTFSELRKLSHDQDKVLLVSHGAYFRHLLFSLMKENIPDELLHRECLIGMVELLFLRMRMESSH